MQEKRKQHNPAKIKELEIEKDIWMQECTRLK